MPRRAGRPAPGSGRAPGKVGRGAPGLRRGRRTPPPAPVLSGALGAGSAPGATRSSASVPAPLGAAACDPERSGGPRGESEASGPGSGRRPGPSRTAGEDPRGRARRAAAPGGSRCGGRGRRRPAGSWREHGAQPRAAARAGPLPWFQTTAPTGASLPLLHAQLVKRRMTARATRAGAAPWNFSLRMALVRFLKDFSSRGFWGSESNYKLFGIKRYYYYYF